MNLSSRLIIAGIVILVLLVFFTLLLGNVFKKKEVTTTSLTPIPTQSFEAGGGGNIPVSTPTQDQLKILSPDQSDALLSFKNKLPYSSPDFDIGYSPTLGVFFVQKKTPQADDKLQQYLKDNNMLDIFGEFPNLFTTTDQPVDQAIQQAEQGVSNTRDQNFQEQQSLTPTPTEEGNPDLPTKSFSDFQNFMQTMFSYDTSGLNQAIDESNRVPTETPIPGGGGGGNIPPSDLPGSCMSKSLADIFTEAGTKVGMTPKLVEGTMAHECSSPFGWSGQKIKAYSQPGKGIPSTGPDSYCYRSHARADPHCVAQLGSVDKCLGHGPMQFLPGTFQDYSGAVKRLDGNSNPYIENIRDSIFAGTLKIKSDGRPKDPLNWTKEEVYKAAGAYSGNCSSGYCVFLWNYYTQHKQCNK